MITFALIIQFSVLGLIIFAMVLAISAFGFSWGILISGLVAYLLSTWIVSSLLKKQCPFCDSSISDKAIKCPKCQSDLPAE